MTRLRHSRNAVPAEVRREFLERLERFGRRYESAGLRLVAGGRLRLRSVSLSQADVTAALDPLRDPYVVSDEVLYRLCRRHPTHEDQRIVIAKMLLIGRTYAAAIERRTRRDGLSNDAFYTRCVGPRIAGSTLDADLSELKQIRVVSQESLPGILAVHARLMRLLNSLTGLNKRSLAAKYLHFHRPNLFFIMDSRAFQALTRVTPKSPLPAAMSRFDDQYATFCWRLLRLRDEIGVVFNQRLKPRELDRLLLRLSSRLSGRAG